MGEKEVKTLRHTLTTFWAKHTNKPKVEGDQDRTTEEKNHPSDLKELTIRRRQQKQTLL